MRAIRSGSETKYFWNVLLWCGWVCAKCVHLASDLQFYNFASFSCTIYQLHLLLKALLESKFTAEKQKLDNLETKAFKKMFQCFRVGLRTLWYSTCLNPIASSILITPSRVPLLLERQCSLEVCCLLHLWTESLNPCFPCWMRRLSMIVLWSHIWKQQHNGESIIFLKSLILVSVCITKFNCSTYQLWRGLLFDYRWYYRAFYSSNRN